MLKSMSGGSKTLPVSLLVLLLVVDGFSIPAKMGPLHHSTMNSTPRPISALQISAASPDEQEIQPSSSLDNIDNEKNKYDDSIRSGLRRLAQLSLEDYDWRMSLFKEKEADRKVEESLARMMGEDASYVRPMDASESKIGPLGRAEKAAVDWLSKVIDEEGRRAKKIVNADGQLVRPIEAGDGVGELGPLGTLEMQLVEFLNSIRNAEKQRVEKGVWRPKDLDESSRGPLGQLELSVVSALRTIQESEMLRMEQSRRRGGEVVRPIDIPGPLGEFELAVAEMIQTERLRAKDGERVEGIIRPMDATVKGRLGECEDQAVEAIRRLTNEERERLRSIQQRLQDNRPMESDKLSLLGILESTVVGILRAPALLIGVFERVKDLLQSENLDEEDKAVLDKRATGQIKKLE